MSKLTKNEVFKELASEEEQNKRKNYTFNLPVKLMEEFVEQCKAKDVSQARVLEKIIQAFLDS